MALTSGKIYIFKSDQGSDADSWSTGGLTDGTDYVVMDIPLRISDIVTTRKEPDNFPGGGNMTLASGYWVQGITCTGLLNRGSVSGDMDALGYWKEFLFDQKTDTGDLYLIIMWGSTDYWPFIDTGDGSVEELCEGTLMGQDLNVRWFHYKQFYIELTFSFMNIH